MNSLDYLGKSFLLMVVCIFRKELDGINRRWIMRSPDILDRPNSDLTSRIKTIKTMSKPFTYGEDYFNVYRNLPGLDYGYTLSSEVDNVKTEFVQDENASKLTLNRKNANIFLSADRTIDYDIYRKSRNIPISFYTLTPQTGTTFADFLNNVLSTLITNSNTVKYKDGYFSLSKIYKTYQESVGFTPYQYISINDFISRMGPYWVNIIGQFILPTTLWMAGNVIENGIFNRSKFKHKLPFRNLGRLWQTLFMKWRMFKKEITIFI